MPIQPTPGKPLGKILAAMFDVQPTNESGYFDSARFQSIDETIDLAPMKPVSPPRRARPKRTFQAPPEVVFASTNQLPAEELAPLPEPIQPDEEEQTIERERSSANAEESQEEQIPTPPPLVKEEPEVDTKEELLGELENIISSPFDLQIELARVGGQFHDLDLRKKPRKIYQRPSASEEVLKDSSAYVRPSVERGSTEHSNANVPQSFKPLPQIELVKVNTRIPVYKYQDIIGRPESWAGRDIAQEFWQKKHIPKRPIAPRKFTFNRGSFSSKWMTVLILTPLVAVGAMSYLSGKGTNIENNVVQNSKNAIANMMDAKQYLEELKFNDAANSFTLAHDDFIKANGTLNKLGASMSWLLKYIPGLNKISSASNMAVAGENIAKVGEDFASILNDIARIKLNNILAPGAGPSLHDLFKNFNEVATTSRMRVNQTRDLLSNVSASVLPDDKRQLFDVFKDKLPELSAKLDEAVNYSAMLSSMIPEKGTKKYLILFQNNSELRATGGFPGSYAVISFTDGRYDGIKIDDSYNPDGQLKNNVIPPQPLQHITPTWGMRDANWFADFPTSAKKVMEFYHDGSGESVDGVLTLTPDILVSILKITGPIDMPEYGIVLNADNFMEQVQTEVEYNQHKPGETPKKILIDFFPRFLANLGSQDSKSLFAIAQIFSDAMKDKHVLAYFNDFNAETVVLKNNFAGIVDNQGRDYLQVVFTNVKGSKTDAVTDSSIKLATKINDDNSVEHELAITRKHNGGDYSLRFYNLQNPDYVRVYVPENAELKSIDGNDVPNFKPLVDYSDSKYKKDPDLKKIETDTSHPQDGVDVYHESGRKVFGFWMVLDPKQTKTITVKYKLTDAYKKSGYHLLLQKQSGTSSYPVTGSFTLPDGSSSDLNTDLNVDREFDIKIK